MGNCTSNPKPPKLNPYSPRELPHLEPLSTDSPTPDTSNGFVAKKSKFFPFSGTPSPAFYFFSKKSPALAPPSEPRSVNSTPGKNIQAVIPSTVSWEAHQGIAFEASWKDSTIPEGRKGGADAAATAELDKSFGFSKQFASKYEIGDEVGRGHFGYTCSAMAKKGELKGQKVAPQTNL